MSADHIKEMRDDAVRDRRARKARRSRRASHRASARHQVACAIAEQHA